MLTMPTFWRIFVRMEQYHHGNLRSELIRRGIEALEAGGTRNVSMRTLAREARVSKTAPYRHFRDKEAFLVALADEGYRFLFEELSPSRAEGRSTVSDLGRAYLRFAAAHPALYRLMTSPLSRKIPREPVPWARKALLLLRETLASPATPTGASSLSPRDVDSVAAAWGYIHGIALLRIDGLFPDDLPEPNWDRLATTFLVWGTSRDSITWPGPEEKR